MTKVRFWNAIIVGVVVLLALAGYGTLSLLSKAQEDSARIAEKFCAAMIRDTCEVDKDHRAINIAGPQAAQAAVGVPIGLGEFCHTIQHALRMHEIRFADGWRLNVKADGEAILVSCHLDE